MKDERLMTIENQLGTILKPEEYDKLKEDWFAYSTNPQNYEGSVVVEMVRQWIREVRA